ncbi:MAG: hypothetical protein OSB03_07795 [Vicinamibacterales bacterium]|jgi:hypothetical protein|nr:hypothetical protein [Vicinamibacterales bacterium]
MRVNRRTALQIFAGGGAGLTLSSPRSLSLEAEALAMQSPTPALEPFRIDYGAEVIDDLHQRLDRFRWPEMPFDPG